MTSILLRQFSSAPRVVAWACLAGITIACWAFLLRQDSADVLRFLCIPYGSAWAPADFATALVMWHAMGLAMMLPSAAPMIATYLDIGEAAAAKQMKVAPAGWLGLGYAGAWLGFGVGAALLQGLLQSAPPESWRWSGGLLLTAAGAYQFSTLKQACLSKCRNPMRYFLARWSERPVVVFGMGLEQGLFCVGCCWAMMLLALVAGLMHPGWMAGVGVLAILEKVLPQPKPLVHGTGIGLIGAGAAMMFMMWEGGHAIW